MLYNLSLGDDATAMGQRKTRVRMCCSCTLSEPTTSIWMKLVFAVIFNSAICCLVHWLVICVSRSSVFLVCGTRLNTRRSPSVMRLVSTDWRWPGTAETPVMRWRRRCSLTSTWMVECSLLETATTTSGPKKIARWDVREVGGLPDAAPVTSPITRKAFGRPAQRSTTCKPVACWWNSTS